jgi:hypothetical protein
MRAGITLFYGAICRPGLGGRASVIHSPNPWRSKSV